MLLVICNFEILISFNTLQEELLQLQQEIKNQSSQKRSIGGSQHLDMQNRNANITLMIGLAIVVALLGIIAGKYVF